ncbi:MAG: alpha/beta hydrolase [Phototrophicaceae bacterium]
MSRYALYLLILLIALPTFAQDDIHLISDIPYVGNGHESQTLDIYLPSNYDDPLAIILMVHGGGFIAGDKSEMQGASEHYASLGYAVIAPNYRLAPEFIYPSAHADVFCALAWTLAHAEDYNLDSAQLFLMGESAGANIIALLATIDDPNTLVTNCDYTLPDSLDIQAVFALYMPVDLNSCECQLAKQLASIYLDVNVSDWLDSETQDLWQSASIINKLDKGDPAFYLIHGANDFLVPVSESEFFATHYQAVGGEAELVVFEGANHGFFTTISSAYTQEALGIIDGWLDSFEG